MDDEGLAGDVVLWTVHASDEAVKTEINNMLTSTSFLFTLSTPQACFCESVGPISFKISVSELIAVRVLLGAFAPRR